jgi:hypothetical protein
MTSAKLVWYLFLVVAYAVSFYVWVIRLMPIKGYDYLLISL